MMAIDRVDSDMPDLSTESPDSPGSRLKLVRLEQGLSEKEVSERLHITMHYVRCIEADLYDKLPAILFARGYIKSYALLLGLDAEQFTSDFDSYIKDQKTDREQTIRRIATSRRVNRNLPWLVFSLVAFIVGFLGLWLANQLFGVVGESSYLSNLGGFAGDNESGISASSLVAEFSSGTAPESTVVPDQSEPLAATVALSLPEGTNAGTARSLTPDLQTEPVPAAAHDPDVPATTPLDTGPVDAEAGTVPVPTRLIEVVNAGTDLLEVRFTGESWVEITDSNSLEPYRDIREAGDVLQVTGRAPFIVLLGDAPFVSLALNGVAVDLSNDIRIDNSARLVVGL